MHTATIMSIFVTWNSPGERGAMTFDIRASGCGERFVPLLTRELKKAKVVNGWAFQRWPEAFVGAKIAVTART